MVAWSSTIEAAGLDPDWSSILDRNLPGTETFAADLKPVVDQLRSGASLTPEQGMVLWNHANLATVAMLADAAKHARFGADVFFNSNLHVNQTNICTLACRFCAFRRGPKAADAYALDIQGYLDRIEPFADRIDEVHTVGGLHPEWDITHYEALFRAVKDAYPQLHIKALTAVEIKHIAELSTLSVIELLTRLKSAGLDSLPGGGAEILDDSVRDRICLGKETSQEYLSIHRDAHSIGLPSNCTMLFGTVETPEQRIAHLCSLRQLQSETGGFQCFVPYPYLPDHSRLPDAQLASASEVLRMIAISRLMLDNIPHVKAYRMNLGDHLAELALRHGADDIDGTVGHEEIMHEAGSQTPLDDDRVKLARQIIDAGGRPVQRNTIYTQFRRFDPDDEDRGGMRLPIAMMG
jgi:aminodeoxyfutalosine synthase